MPPKKNVKFAKGRNLVQQKKQFVKLEVESEPDEDLSSSGDPDLPDSEPRDTSVKPVGDDSNQNNHDADSGDDESEADDDQDDGEGDGAEDQDNSKETKLTSEEKKQARKEQREKRKFDFERNERTIFVGNLPSSMDHRDVAKLFKQCGPVESARIRSIVPEKEKLSPKVAIITQRMHPKVDSVNAYVVFAKTDNDGCIKKALEMNGKVIKDHHIRVDRAQHPNSKRLTLTSRKKSIFVGNLRFDLRDDDLISHFQKVGEVDYVRIVRDRATGLGKGFGFVKFMERAAVKKALEMNDSNFKGRLLRVKKVDDKMKMDDSDKGSKQQKGGKDEDGHANQQSQKRKFDGKSPDGPQKKSFNNNKRQPMSHQRNFDKPVNQRKFERTRQHGKEQNRRVRFDLNNNKGLNDHQQQQPPQKRADESSADQAQKFQKVLMTRKTIKKKKTILKKKMNKNRQIKG